MERVDDRRAERPRRCCRTPLGWVRIEEDERGIALLQFTDAPDDPVNAAEGRWLADAEAQLAEYFAGRRRTFDLPVSAAGTDFQTRVWRALRDIPYGQTRGYGDVAAAIGRPGAARAVGMANHRNPVLILIPCHRVVGASGALTGYAAGLERKQYLLELESKNRDQG